MHSRRGVFAPGRRRQVWLAYRADDGVLRQAAREVGGEDAAEHWVRCRGGAWGPAALGRYIGGLRCRGPRLRRALRCGACRVRARSLCVCAVRRAASRGRRVCAPQRAGARGVAHRDRGSPVFGVRGGHPEVLVSPEFDGLAAFERLAPVQDRAADGAVRPVNRPPACCSRRDRLVHRLVDPQEDTCQAA